MEIDSAVNQEDQVEESVSEDAKPENGTADSKMDCLKDLKNDGDSVDQDGSGIGNDQGDPRDRRNRNAGESRETHRVMVQNLPRYFGYKVSQFFIPYSCRRE